MRTDLERLFDPRSIALVGASSAFGTISGQPLDLLIKRGYAGRLYPVNPKYDELLGRKCHRSMAELPETPDLALILVNAKLAVQMLRECGEKGVPFAIVLGSGFAEVGAQGAAMQRELVEVARRFGIGLIGPNCQGMISVPQKVYAGFGSSFVFDYVPGGVSMVTQSGGFGFSVMSFAAVEGGVRWRHVVTTGNESGISTLDLVRYFVDEPGTRIITGYTEGLKDAHRLREVGEAALAKDKPILLWKVGNSEEGRRAAASHTANLGGTMALYQAAFRQTGILRVEDMQDIVDYSRAFESGRRPRGNRVAIITISGGAGILMTDEAIACGLAVQPLSPQTVERLRPLVPAFAALGNPIDLTASIFDDTDLCRKALELIVDDPQVDAIAMANVSLQGAVATKVAREIAAVAQRTDKPIFLAWSAHESVAGAAYAELAPFKVPRYPSPMRCIRALAAVTHHAAAREAYERRRGEPLLQLTSPQARAMVAGADADLSEHRAKQVLAAYGIPVTQEVLAGSADAAAAAAARIGFPVALKIQSPDVPHKTEAGGVRLGLADEAAVRAAYDEILASVRRHAPQAAIEGVLVQEMVAGGVEVILGVHNDPTFGPAVMFGLGGIFTEVLRDVSFRLAPVHRSVALEMIRELKGHALLTGARGRPPADVDALADAICRLSALALDLADGVGEIDVNPLFVFAQGRGVKADALVKPLRRAG